LSSSYKDRIITKTPDVAGSVFVIKDDIWQRGGVERSENLGRGAGYGRAHHGLTLLLL
jgi:hypothetical protein